MGTRVRHVDLVAIVLIGLVAVSAWTVLTHFANLPWRYFLFENADVLYFEHIARDLNDGGNLLDWRLTQAPYLVPDIAGARLLALFHWPIGYVGAVYQVLLGVALVVAWAAVLPGPHGAYFPCATIMLYGMSFWALLYDEPVSLYFGLIGHHSGVGLLLPLLYASIWRAFRSESAAALFATGALTAIAVMSDGLLLVTAVVPSVAYLALVSMTARPRPSLRRSTKLVAALSLGLFFSRVFSWITPFPQDREFAWSLTRQLATLTAGQIRQFGLDVVQYAKTSRVFVCLLAAFVAAYIALVVDTYRSFRHRDVSTHTIVDFIRFALVSAFPLALASQFVLGLYVSMASARQWAMLVLAILVVALHSFRGRFVAYRVVTTAIVLALAVAIHIPLTTGRRDGPVTSRYAAVAECGARQFPAGTAFAADYWIARPLEMYSGGRLRGLPVVPGLQTFSNAGKVTTLRRLQPMFVATGQSLTRSEFVRLFGEPDRTLCAAEGLAAGGIELLDYSRNERFKATLAAKAAAVY